MSHHLLRTKMKRHCLTYESLHSGVEELAKTEMSGEATEIGVEGRAMEQHDNLGGEGQPSCGGGIIWKGKFCPYWGGILITPSPRFFRGGLDGVSRCLKAENNDVGVIEVEDEDTDT